MALVAPQAGMLASYLQQQQQQQQQHQQQQQQQQQHEQQQQQGEVPPVAFVGSYGAMAPSTASEGGGPDLQAVVPPEPSAAAAAPVADGGGSDDAAPEKQLLVVGFNQDYGCFACGTETGFRIFNCDPFRETFRRDAPNGGGIGIVEMLYRCNIIALVGGGQNPRYPINKVMIWDDHQGRCIGELSFRSEVRAVRLRRDRIVVVLEHKIYVYNFADLKLLHQIETIANPRGLCQLSPATGSIVLACPGLHRGQVRVELYDSRRTRFVAAHESALACFALTLDGARLATASSKGTLIRIFSTADGTKLQELRRGADRADIYSLAFAPNAAWLALSSDKGTVHVFALKGAGHGGSSAPEEEVQPVVKGEAGPGGGAGMGSPGQNPSSIFSRMKGVLPKYFSSEWSFAQFHLPDETKSIVAFGAQKNTVTIIGADGSFHCCEFDPVQGGEMRRKEFTRFMRLKAEGEE